MSEIEALLEARKKQLLKIKEEKEAGLLYFPEGTLRISGSRNRVQYYHRTDPKDNNGIYIGNDNLNLVRDLAQKDYNQKVLNAVEKELNAIQKFEKNCPEVKAEEIYKSLHPERQKLIFTSMENDEKYAKWWESVRYQGKPIFDDVPAYITARGERVRSKSEVIIADLLFREGVPYRYEYPLYIEGIGLVFPDFLTLNKRTRKEYFLEHFGMMDDPNYLEKALQKIQLLADNNIYPGENLILSFETKKSPLNQNELRKLIQHYLL